MVVSYLPFPHVSGMAVQLKHVLNSLASRYSVDLLVLRRGKEPYVAKYGNIRVLRVPVGEESITKQKQSFCRALTRQMQGTEYAAVHYIDDWLTSQLKELSLDHKFALVFDLSRALCGRGEYREEAKHDFLKEKLKKAAESADMILAPHVLVLEKLELNFSKDKTFLCSLGVDINRFDWEDKVQSGVTKKILVLDSIGEKSGSKHLIKLLHRLNENDDVVLFWAGPVAKELEPTLKKAIAECGLTEKIKLLGRLSHDRLPQLIAQADLCLVPRISLALQEWGAFPSTILEYMACKRPVVAPRALQFTSFGLTENELFMFDPENWDDCLKTCMAALNPKESLEPILDKAYQWVRGDHSASNTRRRLLRAYGWLASSEEWGHRFSRISDEEDLPQPGTFSGVEDIDSQNDSMSSTVTGLIVSKEDPSLVQMDDVTNIDVNPMKNINKDDENTEPAGFSQNGAIVSGEVEFHKEQTVKIRFEGSTVQINQPMNDSKELEQKSALEKTLDKDEQEFTIEDDG